MYEEQSTWDDETEEWILPKAPKGMEMAGGRGKSGSKSKRKKPTVAADDMPPSDIGKASPTSAEDAEYANDIMGSDDEYGRTSRSGSSGSQSSGMNRSGGPREFDDADAQGGKYFTDDADRQRNDAGRRVLADASALKNEMLSNLVLWGAEDVKLPGGAPACLRLSLYLAIPLLYVCVCCVRTAVCRIVLLCLPARCLSCNCFVC
jgi:hypothetical protein